MQSLFCSELHQSMIFFIVKIENKNAVKLYLSLSEHKTDQFCIAKLYFPIITLRNSLLLQFSVVKLWEFLLNNRQPFSQHVNIVSLSIISSSLVHLNHSLQMY